MRRCIKLFYSFGTRKNCPKNGMNPLLSQLKKSDELGFNSYRVISLLYTSYKILPNILLARMIPYANGKIGEY
jgi:hypothetical protein